MPGLARLVLLLWCSCLALPAAARDAPARETSGYDPIAEDPVFDPDYPPAIEELSFDSGGQRLPGLIYLAAGAGSHPTIVLLHGIPGNEKNLDLAQVLRRAGFNVLFFHYRGAWGAQGDYSLLTLDEDALAAVAFLRRDAVAARYRVDRGKLSLLGHSLGGYTALKAGSQDPGLVCVAALSPANFGLHAAGLRRGAPEARALLDYADSLFMLANFDGERLRQQLLSVPPEELDTTRFGPGLAGKAVFLLVGAQDTVTPEATMFAPVVAAYEREPQLRLRSRVLPGDHSFSWSRLALARQLLDWFDADCR
jgi:pimeloyl-ACP methyl ester carboxylesterase